MDFFSGLLAPFDFFGFTGSKGSPGSALYGDYGMLSNPSGAWDQFKNGQTNEVNAQIAEENLKYQKEWNEQQMNFQRENRDYQRALQQQIFAREDSAYQRTVNDMRAAGISPLAMNGTNGAGEAIQTSPIGEGLSAPQRNYQHQDMGALQALSGVLQSIQSFRQSNAEIQNISADTDSKRFSNEVAPLSFAVQLAGQILQNQDIAASTKNKIADLGLKALQNSALSLDNKFAEETYGFRKGILANEFSMSDRANARDKEAFDYDKFFGVNDSMSDQEREIAFLTTLGGFPVLTKDGYSNAFKNALRVGKVGDNFLNVASDVTDIISKFIGKGSDRNRNPTFSRSPRYYNYNGYGR